MFSHDITLNEFVYSIPICQPEADLGSILHIFHQTNCNSLAIPGENHTWGIVSSSDVLSLLAKSWQQLPISIVGYPKKTPHQYSFSIDTIRDFNSLVQPAIVYQADTYVEEFLRSLEDKYFNVSQSKYLIVNRAGELKGKLDQDKLLRYVASKYNGYSEKSTLPMSSTSWLSLLDNLALPLKIETVEQKTCYENRCWQKLISHNRHEYLVKSQELNVSIANWWMEKQLDVRWQNLDEQNQVQADSTEKFCCLEDGYYSLYKPNTLSQPIDLISLNQKNIERQQSSIEYSNNCATPSLFGNLAEQPLENYTAGIRVEEGIEWNYIKIPMKLGNEQISSTQAAEYWLVLAIEPSLLCNDHQLKESAPTVKSTVDSLLASISHELKSPLTGIVGLSNLMSSQKLGDLNQRQIKYVQLIHNSGQKLVTIVNDLIELTSLTTGKFQLQPEEINLESLFHKLYQQVITKLNIDPTKSDLPISTAGLELNIPSGLETAIVDRLRLSSIISHLMRETIQFSDSPSIALKIEVKDSNKSRAITVKNETINALAFPEEKLNIPSQSVGLNLIIAKYLAQAIQGDIQSKYYSDRCSFTLIVPVESQLDNLTFRSNQTKSDRHFPEKNPTILCLYPESEVIDPNIGDNHGLDFELKKWAEQDWSDDEQQIIYQHRIIEADGLEQAHTLARIWQLDIIVLDGYQIVDSYKYLQSLKESEYLSALPLITLDSKTSEAANQIEGLNVYPCLLPTQYRSIKDLMQVIQIAIEQ